jgi:hypothetical protein
MRSACTWMPEKGTQTLSPSPDLIPAKNLTGNSHFDWYGKRGHFRGALSAYMVHISSPLSRLVGTLIPSPDISAVVLKYRSHTPAFADIPKQ